MAFGIVKWFNNHKGFGFIESSEIGQDVFAHFSEVEMIGFKTLQQGASVVYEPMEGPRGWMAKKRSGIRRPNTTGFSFENPAISSQPAGPRRMKHAFFRG